MNVMYVLYVRYACMLCMYVRIYVYLVCLCAWILRAWICAWCREESGGGMLWGGRCVDVLVLSERRVVDDDVHHVVWIMGEVEVCLHFYFFHFRGTMVYCCYHCICRCHYCSLCWLHYQRNAGSHHTHHISHAHLTHLTHIIHHTEHYTLTPHTHTTHSHHTLILLPQASKESILYTSFLSCDQCLWLPLLTHTAICVVFAMIAAALIAFVEPTAGGVWCVMCVMCVRGVGNTSAKVLLNKEGQTSSAHPSLHYLNRNLYFKFFFFVEVSLKVVFVTAQTKPKNPKSKE